MPATHHGFITAGAVISQQAPSFLTAGALGFSTVIAIVLLVIGIIPGCTVILVSIDVFIAGSFLGLLDAIATASCRAPRRHDQHGPVVIAALLIVAWFLCALHLHGGVQLRAHHKRAARRGRVPDGCGVAHNFSVDNREHSCIERLGLLTLPRRVVRREVLADHADDGMHRLDTVPAALEILMQEPVIPAEGIGLKRALRVEVAQRDGGIVSAVGADQLVQRCAQCVAVESSLQGRRRSQQAGARGSACPAAGRLGTHARLGSALDVRVVVCVAGLGVGVHLIGGRGVAEPAVLVAEVDLVLGEIERDGVIGKEDPGSSGRTGQRHHFVWLVDCKALALTQRKSILRRAGCSCSCCGRQCDCHCELVRAQEQRVYNTDTDSVRGRLEAEACRRIDRDWHARRKHEQPRGPQPHLPVDRRESARVQHGGLGRELEQRRVHAGRIRRLGALARRCYPGRARLGRLAQPHVEEPHRAGGHAGRPIRHDRSPVCRGQQPAVMAVRGAHDTNALARIIVDNPIEDAEWRAESLSHNRGCPG
eukprot:m.138052 g.138052  ORF g.138052 m.138052 type:complete len:536 (-) comp9591_c0_seq1:96-1703(-)